MLLVSAVKSCERGRHSGIGSPSRSITDHVRQELDLDQRGTEQSRLCMGGGSRSALAAGTLEQRFDRDEACSAAGQKVNGPQACRLVVALLLLMAAAAAISLFEAQRVSYR